jgi:hypothetical protein
MISIRLRKLLRALKNESKNETLRRALITGEGEIEIPIYYSFPISQQKLIGF